MKKQVIKGICVLLLIFLLLSFINAYIYPRIENKRMINKYKNITDTNWDFVVNNVEIFNNKEPKIVEDWRKDRLISVQDKDVLVNKIIEDELIYILENIDIDNQLISGIKIYNLPYKLKNSGTIAFALPDLKTVCIGGVKKYSEESEESIRINARMIIIHELGHVVSKSLDQVYGHKAKREYNKHYDGFSNYDKYNIFYKDWGDRQEEGFAEDFRIYIENKIYGESTIEKGTNQKYNPKINSYFDIYLYNNNAN